MPDTELKLTNADLWLATQSDTDGEMPAFVKIAKLPCSGVAARNVAALSRAVESATKDLLTTRNTLVQRFGTKSETEETWTVQAGEQMTAFLAEWGPLMQEEIVLPNVRPMKISEWAKDVFVSPEDVARCGPLLID